jgi:hypothetical protein
MASSVSAGNVVTVSYTKPSINPIQISSGGQAESISLKQVTNNAGISNKSAPVMVVYQEPEENILNVVSGNAESGNQVLRISSHSGEVLLESKLENTKTQIPISLKKGVYIINILSDNSVIHVQKLIIL